MLPDYIFFLLPVHYLTRFNQTPVLNFPVKLFSLRLSMTFTTKYIEHSLVLILIKLFCGYLTFLIILFPLKFSMGLTKIFMLAQAVISLYLHSKLLKVKRIQPCFIKQNFMSSFLSQLCSKVNSKPLSEVNFDCPAWRHS